MNITKTELDEARLVDKYIARSLDPYDLLENYEYCSESEDDKTPCIIKIFSDEPDRIHQYLQKAFTLGSGGYSTTYLVKTAFKQRPDLVAKYLRDSDNIEEVIIGLYGVNQLRDHIPNFSKVYGFINCNQPIVSSSHDAIVCPKEGSNKYIFYEYISGTPLSQCGYLSEDEELEIYWQLVASIAFANEQTGFVHFDMKSDNIMIRQFLDPVKITYRLKDREIIITSRYVAVLIDYGLSRIEINGENFGINYPGYFIHSDVSNPLVDVYKLTLSRRYANVRPFYLKLSLFFTKDSNIIYSREEFNFSWTVSEKLLKSTIYDFLDFLQEKYPLSVDHSAKDWRTEYDIEYKFSSLMDFYAKKTLQENGLEIVEDLDPENRSRLLRESRIYMNNMLDYFNRTDVISTTNMIKFINIYYLLKEVGKDMEMSPEEYEPFLPILDKFNSMKDEMNAKSELNYDFKEV